MREQLIKYVELLFAGTPNSYDIQQEILQNTLDRYDDLISQGKTPEAAYRLAISGIGDINEILGNTAASESPAPAPAVPEKANRKTSKRKVMQAVAIGMYICCVLPVIILGDIGNGIIGVCLMFLIIAAATVLIILASSGSKEKNAETDTEKEPKDPLYKAYKSVSGIVTLVIYLGISFWSGAWYITWLVFPISGAIDGIVKAIFELKEAK